MTAPRRFVTCHACRACTLCWSRFHFDTVPIDLLDPLPGLPATLPREARISRRLGSRCGKTAGMAAEKIVRDGEKTQTDERAWQSGDWQGIKQGTRKKEALEHRALSPAPHPPPLVWKPRRSNDNTNSHAPFVGSLGGADEGRGGGCLLARTGMATGGDLAASSIRFALVTSGA